MLSVTLLSSWKNSLSGDTFLVTYLIGRYLLFGDLSFHFYNCVRGTNLFFEPLFHLWIFHSATLPNPRTQEFSLRKFYHFSFSTQDYDSLITLADAVKKKKKESQLRFLSVDVYGTHTHHLMKSTCLLFRVALDPSERSMSDDTWKLPSGPHVSSDLCTGYASLIAVPVFALVPCCRDSACNFNQISRWDFPAS